MFARRRGKKLRTIRRRSHVESTWRPLGQRASRCWTQGDDDDAVWRALGRDGQNEEDAWEVTGAVHPPPTAPPTHAGRTGSGEGGKFPPGPAAGGSASRMPNLVGLLNGTTVFIDDSYKHILVWSKHVQTAKSQHKINIKDKIRLKRLE